jgi:hypothetical protein
MIRYSLLLILLSISSHFLTAQVQVSGRVLDDENGGPLTNASVYINNTTIGAVTNEKGEYVLRGIFPGQYEMIVSHVGYDIIVHPITIGRESVRITFRQVPKAKEMRDILVVTSSQRKKWLEIMRINFLGQTSAADKCRILNEDDIFFARTDSKDAIKAFSEVPLVIENKELGYTIHFELQEFFYDAIGGQTRFYGFSRYEELKDDSEGPARKYQRARRRNYKGSTLHFYHALLDNTLEREGFSIYITMSVRGKDSIPGNSPSMMADAKTTPSGEKQEPRLAIPAAPRDILFYDSVQAMRYLTWNGILTVRFKEDPYYKTSLRNKVFIEGNLPIGFQASIRLLQKPAYIDNNGIFLNPLSVQYSGFWVYEKLANMMPINYRPGSN